MELTIGPYVLEKLLKYSYKLTQSLIQKFKSAIEVLFGEHKLYDHFVEIDNILKKHQKFLNDWSTSTYIASSENN